MSDFKDSTIKLFGKTIPLPIHSNNNISNSTSFLSSCSAIESCSRPAHEPDTSTNATATATTISSSSSSSSSNDNENESGKEQQEVQELTREYSRKEITDFKQVKDGTEGSKDPTTSSGVNNEKSKNSSAEIETSPLESSKDSIGKQSETGISQEKTNLKKPDKILPCPRCNSMDTKFCYYNNYNVNQPRHFCKNCQRYWTAGGTMRNVPVGAGRRKNKSSSASHYRHIMVSEALRTAQVHAMNVVCSSSSGNSSTTVLNFGSDNSPLCESVASVLNLSAKSPTSVRNGYHHRPEQRVLISGGRTADNRDDHLTGSSVIDSSNSMNKGGNCCSTQAKNYQGFPATQVACFPGPPWPYPWSSTMPAPTFCPSGFPVSFYRAPPYWGCTVPSPWNIPVPPCISPQSPSLSHCPALSPTSPLRKHSREGNILNPSHSELEASRESDCAETRVLVPKTLRIDDPSEAARSSIWATLGIKGEKSNMSGAGGLFKGFQSKNEDGNYIAAEKSPVLHANPAALSRSLNFHERT